MKPWPLQSGGEVQQKSPDPHTTTHTMLVRCMCTFSDSSCFAHCASQSYGKTRYELLVAIPEFAISWKPRYSINSKFVSLSLLLTVFMKKRFSLFIYFDKQRHFDKLWYHNNIWNIFCNSFIHKQLHTTLPSKPKTSVFNMLK